jgi:hypothetical protein
MVGAAVLLCVVGVGTFLFADKHRINELWVFFALNALILIPIFAKRFRGYWKKPAFIAFFAGWMAVHGLLIVSLMHRVPFSYWPFFMLLEFTAGLLLAKWLFGISPSNQSE